MPVNVSFALTTEQILTETKTVTRRSGKRQYKAGQRIQAVNKAMGFKKGEHPIKLKLLEVVSATYEPLNEITQAECVREGFPHFTPQQFIDMYCKANKCKADSLVQRIEFKYVKEEKQMELNSKPKLIQAHIFIRDNYAEKIRLKECRVETTTGYQLVNVESDRVAGVPRFTFEFADKSKCTTHNEDLFVTWLPADATAQLEATAGKPPLNELGLYQGASTDKNPLIGNPNLPLRWIELYRSQVAEGCNKDGQSNNVLDLADLAEALQVELVAAKAENGRLRAIAEAAQKWMHMSDDVSFDESILICDALMEAVAKYEQTASENSGNREAG